MDYPTRKIYLLRLIYDNQQCCDSFYKNKPHWHKVFRLRKSEVQNFPWVNSFKDFCAKVLQKYKPRSVKLFYKLNFPHFSSFFFHILANDLLKFCILLHSLRKINKNAHHIAWGKMMKNLWSFQNSGFQKVHAVLYK